MTNNKTFVFLYPEVDIMNNVVGRNICFLDKKRKEEFLRNLKTAKSKEEKTKISDEDMQYMKRQFEFFYKKMLNDCIDVRYRQRGFDVFYALLNNSPISPFIKLQPRDYVIFVGMDAKTHRTERPDGTYLYPDNDFIINQLNETKILRIGGFHMWDCVEKLAKRAYERGIDTLVDEDLTEFFPGRIVERDFDLHRYPTFNPRTTDLGSGFFECFIEARKGKAWLWQDY